MVQLRETPPQYSAALIKREQLKATAHSLVEVDDATGMEQTVQWHPGGGARLITTRWYDLCNRTLRQDQSVLVDPLPTVAGRNTP